MGHLTAISAETVRKLFPNDNVLAQPWIQGDDVFIFHGSKELKRTLIRRANLTQALRNDDGSLNLYPEMHESRLPNGISYVRITREGQDKVHAAGFPIEVIEDIAQARQIIFSEGPKKGQSIH